MGKIVGAGLLSHSPVIMFPEEMRVQANGGKDFTLATGLKKLRTEIFDQVEHDTVLVLDTHWLTTTEFIVSSHAQRKGTFTSSEMPLHFSQVPYDCPGDPELALALAREAKASEVWLEAVDDPQLPIQYATLNLQSYLDVGDKAWVSLSLCQTATSEDFLRLGEVISRAAEKADRRVMLIASGALSHQFVPLMELRERMSGAVENIASPEARKADLQRIEWLERGDHRQVINAMPEYLKFEPEARFGHYLALAGAFGGEDCSLSGQRFSEYESGIGTGHIHLWFTP